jgi:hypothetical protein
MGSKNSKYEIVYRGEALKHLIPGQFVFFQREKEYGGDSGLAKRMMMGSNLCWSNPLHLVTGLRI